MISCLPSTWSATSSAEDVRALMRDPIALPAQADRLAGLFLDGLLLVGGELVYPLLKAIRLREGQSSCASLLR
jgi:hypothetical protein